MTTTDPGRGVFFLADDRIIDLTLAFLNSFRLHNPEIRLALIPCYDRSEQSIALQREYDFEVYADPAVLSRCDRISARFHDHVYGHYRKLAMWEGPFDRFLYIDVDTVVLSSVDFVFKYLDRYDFVASHSNCRGLRRWVWKRSVHRSGLLDREQIAFSANTGFLASKRGALALEHAESAAGDAPRLRPHMELHCIEQPFLNYLIVTSGRPYTSLSVLERRRDDPDMMAERWAGERLGFVRGGTIRFPGRRPPTLLLHWAGKWQPTSVDRRLRALWRRLGGGGGGPEAPLRLFMRYKRLWNHYRYLRDPGRS